MLRILFQACLSAILVLVTGCATVPYQYGNNLETDYTLRLRPEEPQIERGRPVAFLDGAGHYVVSIPSKLILWNWDVDNHHISPESEEAIREYLADNDLQNVKVRLNQYSPGSEWRRLIRNREMPGFFKYTLGVLSTSWYTIFPERFFAGLIGGDHYNPYTNTINVYSDEPAILLHEAAHAKDFAGKGRHYRGWYATMRLLPLVPLWQEARATGDSIGYTIEEEKTEEQRASYKTLYPAYATYVAGEGLRWAPLEPWISFGVQFLVAIPGHVVGRIKAALVEDSGDQFSGKSE